MLALGCAAWSSHAAFVAPLPSFAGGRGRGRAHTAVVAERPSSTPSIYSAAAGGQGEEETQVPPAAEAVVAVEAKKKSPREEDRKSKHFDFLKVCVGTREGGARHVRLQIQPLSLVGDSVPEA